MGTVPREMRAWRIRRPAPLAEGHDPLVECRLPVPVPGPGEVLVRVLVCGVCRTDLDLAEGRVPLARLPITPGHQVIGEVVAAGPECRLGLAGRRVGVAWIHSACGACRWCREGRENLCPGFRSCGADVDGGYAEFLTVPEAFVHPLHEGLDPLSAAPLLCAGAVGLRALRLCHLQDGQAVGLTGFGASGRLVLQLLRHLLPASPVHVFARKPADRDRALALGASWAGATEDPPPGPLTAIIDTTPAWAPVRAALAALEPGGRLVINAIAKETEDRDQLLQLDYREHLWREKVLRTVTNVTRSDVRECLRLAAEIPLHPLVEACPPHAANAALRALRAGGLRGACVLQFA